MILNKIKWTALGVALTLAGVFFYNNRDILKNLKGSNYNKNESTQINPEFANYISAFTTGYISSGSTIKIKLSSEFASTTMLNVGLKENYFSFDPSIEGETVWKDGQTMEFKPKGRLTPGQKYKVTFHLNKLIEVKSELQKFEFQFEVIKQSLQLQVNDLKSYHSNDYNFYSLSGNIATADFAENDLVEKTLSAKLESKTLTIKWIHNDNGTSHKFLIDSINRGEYNKELHLSCDAKPLTINYTSSQDLLVPAREVFVFLGAKVVNENDQFVLLNFSNPVNQIQTLEGLINIGNSNETKFIINNNQVLVYPSNAKAGSHVLKINEGIRDTKNHQLSKSSEHNIVFSEVKPAVKFSGSGSILPSTNSLTIPFETVNLRAVDVKIIKIYENNIVQFLQNNDLNGGENIAQVGKKIIQKRINLGITNPADFGVWKKFSLDIGSLIKSEPGAIYRVVLSFKKSYSTYPCIGNSVDEKFDMEEIKEPEDENEITYYSYYYDSYYNDYEYDEDEEYRWEDRENPCKGQYYRQYGRAVAKNILASDLALTLKKGNDGSLFVAANNLITTMPVSGVALEFYDYQKQLILSASTNGDGQAFINLKQKAYFVVAKKDKQRAYLKLDDGASLSLSMYDVSGDAIKKGVKGFIYGERGVWRPGDSLFLNFILEDELNSLPTNHPVSFELTNPQGQIVKRILSNKSVDGFYNFATATDKNAPTGFWTAEVKIGAIKFTKLLRIETIMPNRLKIDVNVGDNKLIIAEKQNAISLHTAWLTGAEAKSLRANVSVALKPVATEFSSFKEFTFDDQTLRFDAQTITVFDDKVDEKGNATIPMKLDVQKNAPGFLKASFNTTVFEPGGAFSVDRFSVDYSPYTFYTGIKMPKGEKYSGILYTERDHSIDIATVDYHGNPVSRSNLKFELFKLEWRWWWDQYQDELANYSSDTYHKPIQTQLISSKNGKANVTVNIKENDWGRYLIRVIDLDGGHSTSTVAYFDWANWMDRDGGAGENKILSNMLNFSSDKNSYKTNEEVKITIPSPEKGRALVTLENGSRVLEAHWLETEKGSTVFKFKVTQQMAPTIYVHVSLIQPHSRTNDLPIRLYGVVPITVDDPETHLHPIISMAKTLVPEQDATITISEENNKEMAFTLAVVDEGLLDITRFKTPNPYTTFYAKEALGVKTWDIYDNVIGAFGADLERILSIGGDGSELSKDGAKANRFKPMVKFFGPYHLSKGEKRVIKFKMPMYVGAVRTMLIAGEKGAYGITETSTPVKAPIMILGTLPRVLSVGEEVKLPVSVFGGEKALAAVNVKVEVNGLLQTAGANAKTISLAKNEEKLVAFDIKVKNQTGIAKAKITASGGGHTTVYEIELDVRNPNPYQTDIKDMWIEAGTSFNQNINPLGLSGTNSGMLELSTIPAINLEERLNYLITYPHGCVEQTTSQTFAQLYLSTVMELSAERKTDIEKNIKHGINELQKFQLSSGAMSYWQGSNETSDWGTSYAGHFLICAEKKGYTLPAGFKKDWTNYQQSTAQNFEVHKNKYESGDVTQAYRLYVLSLANAPVLSAMNRLREYPNLSNQAKWLLASAYAQIGQNSEAEKLISTASKVSESYFVNYYTYGSSDRDMAIVLQALCLMNKKQQAFDQLKKVAGFLSSKSWLSTQTTAFGLVAVANFVQKFGSSSAMQATGTVNGLAINIKGNAPITQIPFAFKSGKASINLTNNGKGMLFARIVNRGKPPIGEEKEANENISTSVVYKDMSGAAINPEELTQGLNFMLEVTVKNLGLKGSLQNIALINYIPSGWEIHNARMDDNEAALKSSVFTYQDIKDDKVLTYFDLSSNETKTFKLMLNASYEGRYYLPAINVEAMYDNSVFARTKGQWIKVVKQKK